MTIVIFPVLICYPLLLQMRLLMSCAGLCLNCLMLAWDALSMSTHYQPMMQVY